MLREKFSVKGCVNDARECRNNCRRNSLKEMRWNRIKRTSSRMTGKDEFRDFCLREWREVGERVYVNTLIVIAVIIVIIHTLTLNALSFYLYCYSY